EHIQFEGLMMVENKHYGELMTDSYWMDERLKEMLMIGCLSIVETDKDKETGSSDGLQPNQPKLSYVHAFNKQHLHETHVVPSTHDVDKCTLCANPKPV
nr:hypothetical protein [Tanacetum cinerariifolium]